MKRLVLIIGLLSLTLVGCSRDDSVMTPNSGTYLVADDRDHNTMAAEIIESADWEYDPEVDLPAGLAQANQKNGWCFILEFNREILVDDIAHYSWVIKIGDGPYDAIGLHRVVRERRPYQTRHTAATLWLAAGESPEWIARQMGHATTTMLFRVYSRFVPNLTRKDGSAFERLLTQNFII